MTPDCPLFPIRARWGPLRVRRGRIECGYLRAHIEDLYQAISGCGSPTRLCPFISLGYQGRMKGGTVRTA